MGRVGWLVDSEFCMCVCLSIPLVIMYGRSGAKIALRARRVG